MQVKETTQVLYICTNLSGLVLLLKGGFECKALTCNGVFYSIVIYCFFSSKKRNTSSTTDVYVYIVEVLVFL